jgi:hypothetical protein
MNPVNEDDVDYERDKNIDVMRLHEEWLRQPALCGTYNLLLAQAEEDADKAKKKVEICKANLAETKAKLDLRIRRKPEDYEPPINKKGEISTTEAWIASVLLVEAKQDEDCIDLAKELSEAQDELIKANKRVAVYNAGVKTMIDRKPALEQAVLLWMKGYYAIPKLPRPLVEEYLNVQDSKREETEITLRKVVQPARPQRRRMI